MELHSITKVYCYIGIHNYVHVLSLIVWFPTMHHSLTLSLFSKFHRLPSPENHNNCMCMVVHTISLCQLCILLNVSVLARLTELTKQYISVSINHGRVFIFWFVVDWFETRRKEDVPSPGTIFVIKTHSHTLIMIEWSWKGRKSREDVNRSQKRQMKQDNIPKFSPG